MSELEAAFKIVSVVVALSGWAAFFLELRKHRSQRPVLRFMGLKCLKNEPEECLQVYGSVVNYGNVSAACQADCLVYDPQSSKVYTGRVWWREPRENNSTHDETLYVKEIGAYQRAHFFADFYIYTPQIQADGAFNGRALDPLVFPTRSRSSSFLIIPMVIFGSSRIYDYFEIQIVRTIEVNMEIEEVLKCLYISEKRSWRLSRRVKRIVRNYDWSLEALARRGLRVIEPTKKSS